jgi:hypothetical protein
MPSHTNTYDQSSVSIGWTMTDDLREFLILRELGETITRDELDAAAEQSGRRFPNSVMRAPGFDGSIRRF